MSLQPREPRPHEHHVILTEIHNNLRSAPLFHSIHKAQSALTPDQVAMALAAANRLLSSFTTLSPISCAPFRRSTLSYFSLMRQAMYGQNWRWPSHMFLSTLGMNSPFLRQNRHDLLMSCSKSRPRGLSYSPQARCPYAFFAKIVVQIDRQ